MRNEAAIEMRNLTKDYGHGRGIFDFSFSVQRGEVYGLIGTNGSGKTTTIRHMMGFLNSDKGSVKIAGMDAWKDAAKIKRLVGYVPGQIDFPDVGSDTSFLKIQADLMGLKDMTVMDQLIDRFKIDITAPLKRMSKGMKQKMALVAAFMGEPEIYLLDEPSTGLDPLMRDALIDLILQEKAKGKTIFMSSHIFKELEDTCDAILFIRDGKMVGDVHRSQYENDPHENYTITFASERAYEVYADPYFGRGRTVPLGTLLAVQPERNQLTVNISVNRTNAFLADLARYPIAGFSNEPYSLEKYYVNVIEHREVQ